MNKKTIYIAFIFALLLSISCERILDIDLSKEKPLIVMNGTIMPDMPINISISKSYSVLETDSMAPFLKDVSVELHINDKFVEKLHLVSVDSARNQEKRGISYFQSVAQAKIGDRVRIEATAPGFETAWAETTIPIPTVIEKVDTTLYNVMVPPNALGSYDWSISIFPDSITREPFMRMMRLKTGLKTERTNDPQYFMISLTTLEPYNNPDNKYMPKHLIVGTKDDPIFANDTKNSFFDIVFEKNLSYNQSTLFMDNLFKNGAYTLNVTTGMYYSLDIKTEEINGEDNNEYPYPYYTERKYVSHEVLNFPITISVNSLSPEYYRYLKSQQTSSYDDELYYITEPKATISNVVNGIGVVGAISTTKKEIKIPPYPGGKNTIPW